MPPLPLLLLIDLRHVAVATFASFVVAAAALCCFLGAAAAAAPASPSTVAVSAHRGGAGQWPQNSLLAFRRALAAGYDEIEADTWILSDGHHVIYHDATVSRARCGGRYAARQIWRLTWSQVRTIRCQGQPIPTQWQLVSLVARSSNRHTVLRLETKSYPGQSAASARNWARRVGGQVVAARLTSRTVMEDLNWNGIAGYHAASPRLRASAVIGSIRRADVVRAHRLGAYDISYRAGQASAALNAHIAANHLVPTVWGVDPVPAAPGPPRPAVAAAAQRSFAAAVCSGARVVITNYPALLIADRATLTCPR